MDINFNHIEFNRNNNSSKQRKACGECNNSFEHTAKMCPNKPCCSHCNETGHVSSACEIVKEKNRARNRIEKHTACFLLLRTYNTFCLKLAPHHFLLKIGT